MKLKGAEILVQCLLEQGVNTVFGYPGGSVLDIYDALLDHPEIKHILTAHEQGAAHAADGFARSTGRTGVCIATSGPGAANLTTGIATAYMDSSPVVFITCNVSGRLMGRDAFQEVDITGITLPITKCNYLVRDVDSLADSVREGFAIASSGRPGPVLIDIQKNVTSAEGEYEYLPRERHFAHGRLARLMKHAAGGVMTAPEPDSEDIAILASMIKKSKKPLIICGGGVVRGQASEPLREIAAKQHIPVAFTVMGAGGFPGRDPLCTGLIGMHGSQASNIACGECDLLIAVGCRFTDRVALNPETFAPNAKIVQIDIDASEIDKNVHTDHHIIGGANKVLARLNAMLGGASRKNWRDFVFSHSTETVYEESGGSGLSPAKILTAAAEILPDDTVVTTDVGQHQMWAVQHFKFSYPGQLITPGGFGTMGFGLGAAIGAKAGDPSKCVLHVTGDGSFRMNSNELSTEQFYGLPVITLLFNNSALGMVRQWQKLLYDGRYSQTDTERGPDFVKLAEAYGVESLRVNDIDSLRGALKKAVSEGRGCVIECIIDPDELVMPMVDRGNPLTNFIID